MTTSSPTAATPPARRSWWAINLGAEAISVPLADPVTASLAWEPVFSTVVSGRHPLEGLVLRLAAHEAVILRASLPE